MEPLKINIKDDGGIWPRISKEFMERLPLRNLIWKGGMTQAPRFVERLEMQVSVVEDDKAAAADQAAPANGQPQQGALLHIYLVEADVDGDMYKSVVRPRIKNWVAKVSQTKGESWLVVYVASAGEIQRMATAPKFLGMRASVFDRMRSDVAGKSDSRVVMLQEGRVDSWNSVFLALRERVVQALEERVQRMSDEIRRMDANRMLPGWNYCRFFVFKEALISLYRLMGLLDEALAHYDELEAAFFQLLDAQQLAWFPAFGGGRRGDDFTDLLDLRKKPYRQLMVDNAITMFDFRMYLFGQQCQLLIDMARYEELAERAQRFVATLSKSMRERGTGLSLAFVASWTYSTCSNIVEICEGVQQVRGPAAAALAAAKAEFLINARQQLDILGMLYERLPPKYLRRSNTYIRVPSPLLATPPSDEDDNKERLQEFTGDPLAITNPVLTEALTSDERFDQIYVRTCEQGTQYCLDCGRRRFAQVLQGDIAQLHISRTRWADAARILGPLVSSDTSQAPGVMDVHLMERLAVCERQLGNTARCFDYVVRLVASSQFLDVESRGLYADMLVELAAEMPRTSTTSSGLFSVSGAVTPVDRDDTLCLALPIHSLVPRFVVAARIDVLLVSADDQNQLEAVFSAQNIELHASSTVHVTSDALSCPGRFLVRSVHICLGNVEFDIVVSTPNNRCTVRLNPHPLNPLVGLRPPPVSHVDGASTVSSSPMFLSSLAIAGVGGCREGRGFLHVGECLTELCTVPTDATSVDVDVRYTTLLALVHASVLPLVDELSERHGLWQHRRHLGQVVLAHVGGTLDSARTLEQRTLVCDPLCHLWAAAAADSAPTARASMRRLFAELSDAVVGSRLAEPGAERLRSQRASLELAADRAAAVSVTASLDCGRFCTVFEPCVLCVQVDGDGGSLWVTLQASDGWMIEGATSGPVPTGGRVSYTVIPLHEGHLALPEVVCYEEDGRGEYQALRVLLAAGQPTPCVLANGATPTVYSVPVVVSPAADA
ncbi:hypothetical protein GGF46_003076 [Coemansia sp. RSA 552]|nr:hypothetical protein GGF46_003076 [Coemansia sp. RSA 552]